MPDSKTSPTTGEVVAAAVRTASADVVRTEPAALADEPDGVHQQRVRVRRLRSVLAGFRGSLDTRSADGLRVRFAEWGRELGVVRDIEVRAAVAEEALERAGIDDPRVVGRLVDSERDAYAAAHARLVELAQSPRAAQRARVLTEFAAAAVVVDAESDAAPLVAAVLAKQAGRVRKAARRIDGSAEGYHDLRKSARRLRYVAEAIAEAAPDLYPDEVEALAETGDALHEALGGHRDAVLFAEHVAREAARAVRAGEPTEAYARIEAEARLAAADHLTEVPEAVRRLRDAASHLL
ncbi:CHAD domain-containing protein [Microbacterium sp. NPDC019599]|uniref:CHAD domain-containing protein n=1 Tax=Microbacterium sp. NPDC019599 TaxID=3154690 RepID=UPI0033F0FDEE